MDTDGDVNQISFHLFPQAFDLVDWTQEPAEDWATLLRERCLQLRDQYSYLRLFYSGGSDSHTVLLAFIQNKIPLDEIVVFRSSLVDNFEMKDNIEANDRALAYLKTIDLGETKITVLDVGSKEYEKAFQNPEQWFLGKNEWDVSSILSNPSLYLLFPELEEPGDIADILGAEKARVGIDQQGYFVQHLDATLCYNLGAPHNEYFFISPDLPQLHLKQVHALKNLLADKFSTLNLDYFYENPGPFMEDYSSLCRYPCWNNIDLGKSDRGGAAKVAYASQAARADNPQLYQKFQCLFDYIPTEFLRSFNDPERKQSQIIGSYGRRYNL